MTADRPRDPDVAPYVEDAEPLYRFDRRTDAEKAKDYSRRRGDCPAVLYVGRPHADRIAGRAGAGLAAVDAMADGLGLAGGAVLARRPDGYAVVGPPAAVAAWASA